MSDNLVYHVVDFLLPAQKFNIQFSYVSQKRLPFIREFVLRLVNVAPMSKEQIATYFGMSKFEADEAISDLEEREELTLSEDGLLILTNQSQDYFSDSGETPLLSAIEDSGANICFDLATFSCIGNESLHDTWKAGLKLKVNDNNTANSEKLVEKHFQRQFYKILDRGYLPSYINGSKEKPSVYTVNNVTKLRELPLRLHVEFKMDKNGKAVVREDFKQLNNSETVHEIMATALSKQIKQDNSREILDAMIALEDRPTIKVCNNTEMKIDSLFLAEFNNFEAHEHIERTNVLGPIYATENWAKFHNILAPIINSRIHAKEDFSGNQFIWIAPSDTFWGKSTQLIQALGAFLNRAQTKEKILYTPTLYVPIGGIDDKQGIRAWGRELKQQDSIRGIKEGFLGGNVEILYLENALISVIYHISKPDTLPVTMPLGFISTDADTVKHIGWIVHKYIKGYSSHDKPNDCGKIV